MALRVSELWFSPNKLRFQSVHVRGPTDWTFFELSDSTGITGCAEITSSQLGRSVVPVVTRLANMLRGERLSCDEDVLRLCRISPEDCEKDRVLATSVSGLRCAVADALARRAEMPLADYLRFTNDQRGESNRSVPLYANINRSMRPDDSGPVDRSPDAYRSMTKKAVQAGFTALKCAPFDECQSPFESPGAGLPPEAKAGLARFAAVKEVVGTDTTVYVDCHSRFDLGSAIALELELRHAGAGWFEEPVDPIKCAQDLKAIREKSMLPVVGGELGYGLAIFQQLIDQHIVDIVMPDVMFCGGPVEAYRVGVELESAKAGTVSLHCPSGPISLLASAHVSAAFGATLPLEHAVYEVDWRHKVIEPFETIESGRIQLPDGNGLGANLNPAVVALRGKQWDK